MMTLRFSRVHFVCKFECKFAQRQPPPRQGGRTVLALQKRRCYALAPVGPANRDAFREPGASPRPKSPTVSKLSWGKNDDIFVRKWAIYEYSGSNPVRRLIEFLHFCEKRPSTPLRPHYGDVRKTTHPPARQPAPDPPTPPPRRLAPFQTTHPPSGALAQRVLPANSPRGQRNTTLLMPAGGRRRRARIRGPYGAP